MAAEDISQNHGTGQISCNLDVNHQMPEVIGTIAAVRSRISAVRKDSEVKMGFVPTMGFFHEGHLSLMRAARSECDFVVVSVYVNPAQFEPTEDIDAYPRDFDRDLSLAGSEGIDLVFAPGDDEIYPDGHETVVVPGSVAGDLCGRSRPGHFSGVATVVNKFFNVIQPEIAYFGQKDAQQAAVIKRMVADLNIPVEVRVCPTVRESDGLAKSSRNSYLSVEERAAAPALYQALVAARQAVEAGKTDAAAIKRLMRRTIGQNYLVEFEYARVVDPETMKAVKIIDGPVLAAVAGKVGQARLIDNLIIQP